MKSRGFFIRNFRNIGVCKDESQGVFLRLSGLEKENMGGLVIILGENNTGKSNLLEALAKFGKINDIIKSNGDIPQDILLQDIPNFCECTNALPKLQMKTYLSSYKIFQLYFPFELWEHEYGYGNDSKAEKEKAFKDFINDLQCKFNSCKVYGDFVNIINNFIGDAIKFIICCEKEQNFTLGLTCDANLTCSHIEELKPQELKLPLIKFHIQVKEDTGNRNVKKQNIEEFLTYLKNNKEHTKEESTTYFLDNQHKLKKEGNQYQNRITFYQEKEIKNEHLITTSDKIHESSFFESLFNSIKVETKDVQESYRRYIQESVPYYKQIEANVNEGLKKVNRQFNDLYHKKDNKQSNDLVDGKNDEVYRFEITMETQQIILKIFKDNQIINLESQSVGFRKFFNLFFNLCNGKTKPKKGDIILIDEAETHLSVPAQIEFRDFLKSFGMQNGLLFVITTHSPFMLDIKYLDEVRILKTKDDGVGIKIINDFSFINNKESEQANTLLKMKDALGVEYFHLLNPNSKPIFVEGITDYNYLTAFTLLYNYDHKDKEIDIVFLPISGLGKKDEEQTTSKSQRSEVLDSLDKFSQKLGVSPAILLADSDKAGKEVRELAKQNHEKIKVILLDDVPEIKECFEGFEEVEVENLFTNTDRLIHFAIKNTNEMRINKIQQQSSYFKCKIKLFIDEQSKKENDRKNEIELNISKETKDNFYAVLEYLHEKANRTSEGTIAQVTHSLSRSE